MRPNRLYKSRTERMIDGVCGGLAEFFKLDVTLVRIAWVLLTLLGGSGILLYLVAMFVMPVNPEPVPANAAAQARSTGANAKFWGILLVVIGILWLLRNLDIPYYLHWWGFSWDYMLPVILIMAGVAFLFGGRSGMLKEPEPAATGTGEASSAEASRPVPSPGDAGAQPGQAAASVWTPARLYKSRSERKLFGVCGGIATYLNVDPTIIRILFVVGALASCGFMILLYIAMAIIVPNEPARAPEAQTA